MTSWAFANQIVFEIHKLSTLIMHSRLILDGAVNVIGSITVLPS